jgi:SAM-dependent methyltransferase
LRGGRRLIDYLDAGRYTGIDISRKALDYAAELVRSSGLLAKRPTLLLNEVKELTFVELGGARFDVLLAQSVFTHLRADNLRTCFAHLEQVLKPDSTFFFTYHERRGNEMLGPKSFGYPKSFFEDLAGRHGYRIDDLSHAYPHPKGQRMLRLTHA